MFDALVNAFRAPDIRKRIFFVLAMLVVVRGLAHVPVPGVDKTALDSVHARNARANVTRIRLVATMGERP